MSEALRLCGPDALVVAGYFDPVTAGHARRIASLAGGGRPLIAVVASPADPLLDARARAELVAGLAAVRAVVIDAPGVLGQAPAESVVSEQDADRAARSALMELVRRKQR